MKFKVGDIVKVKKNLKDIHNFMCGYSEKMSDYEGKIVTIKSVHEKYVEIDEDKNGYNWDFRAFEPINKKPTKEELLKMPVGTKITTDKDYDNIFVKASDSDDVFKNNDDECIWDIDIEKDLSINNPDCGTKIIKIEVPTYETLYDSSEEVKEMTMDEICKALGYNVKIIKEEN